MWEKYLYLARSLTQNFNCIRRTHDLFRLVEKCLLGWRECGQLWLGWQQHAAIRQWQPSCHTFPFSGIFPPSQMLLIWQYPIFQKFILYPCSTKTREVLGNPFPTPKRFPEGNLEVFCLFFLAFINASIIAFFPPGFGAFGLLSKLS